MNGKERILTTLSHREPDMVPLWELIIDEVVIKSIQDNLSYSDFIEKFDIDGVTAGENIKFKEVEKGVYIDEWGIKWRANKDGILYPIGGPIRNEKDIKTYSAPDPDVDYRMNKLEELLDRFKKDRFIVFLSHDVFEFSHYLVEGLQNLFRLYYRNSSVVHKLAEVVIEYKTRVSERALKLGADAIVGGDDYASRKGPLISPLLFKKFIFPHLKRLVDVAKRNNRFFIKHTDGNIWPILDDIIKTGIDALHPIEPAACMDILEIKKHFGDKITVVGNIDCSIVLPHLSPKEVEEVVKETIAKAAPGGGYILSSSNSIHPGVNPKNFIRMIKIAKTYGKYPISPSFIKKYENKDFYRTIFRCAKT